MVNWIHSGRLAAVDVVSGRILNELFQHSFMELYRTSMVEIAQVRSVQVSRLGNTRGRSMDYATDATVPKRIATRSDGRHLKP